MLHDIVPESSRSTPAGALEAPKSFCVLTHCLGPSKGSILGFCDTSIFMKFPKFGHRNHHSNLEEREFHKAITDWELRRYFEII